jgi:hypothetical protein
MAEQSHGMALFFVSLATMETWPPPLTALRGRIKQDYEQQHGAYHQVLWALDMQWHRTALSFVSLVGMEKRLPLPMVLHGVSEIICHAVKPLLV